MNYDRDKYDNINNRCLVPPQTAKLMIEGAIANGERLRLCGSNGGDAVHYFLTLFGEWGAGQVYLSFSNHGYIDEQAFGNKKNINLYDDTESDGLYSPRIEVY